MHEPATRSAFQKLLVWQRGMEVAKLAYRVVHKLPKEEQFGLSGQIRRCAISIPSNIAEGAKRGRKEFAQFLRIANGSAAELETQLLLAEDLYKLDCNAVLIELTIVQKMIESLIKKL